MSEKNIRKENKDTTMEVVFILDRSGSMCGLERDTIGGFNSMLKKEKKQSSNIIWSTILFDDQIEVIHDRVPIRKVQPLTSDEYYVRGSTALLDAVGCAIDTTVGIYRDTIRSHVPDKTLFVITTDGMENSSIRYTYRDIKRKITKEQEKYGWEFIFLGANIDAAAEGGRIGIRASNSATYLNDDMGIACNYSAVGAAMDKMARGFDLDGSELESVREDCAKRGR